MPRPPPKPRPPARPPWPPPERPPRAPRPIEIEMCGSWRSGGLATAEARRHQSALVTCTLWAAGPPGRQPSSIPSVAHWITPFARDLQPARQSVVKAVELQWSDAAARTLLRARHHPGSVAAAPSLARSTGSGTDRTRSIQQLQALELVDMHRGDWTGSVGGSACDDPVATRWWTGPHAAQSDNDQSDRARSRGQRVDRDQASAEQQQAGSTGSGLE
jgi:hypothetical protein